ncbi:MAG TPA: zf-HC2 domain-containing protein [Thermoanaerobaculia bacterium]|nr:zf-HC2 domain-containing protein [Thermoanaerobaculia bacterium]
MIDLSKLDRGVMCREVLTFLSAYLDGELPPDVVAAFDEHIAHCESCVAYIQSYKQTVELGKRALAEEEEAALPEDLLRAVLAARRG